MLSFASPVHESEVGLLLPLRCYPAARRTVHVCLVYVEWGGESHSYPPPFVFIPTMDDF